MESMKEKGIQTSIHYPPIPDFQHYRAAGERNAIPLTRAVASREVTLPLYPKMSMGDVETVVEAVRESVSLM
jgi:dTDP-4-amino-4,6-dideoxygalactose transaminase